MSICQSILIFEFFRPLQKPTAAPAPASGGLTAEQRARIEANKARALALQRERAAKAAEDRAGAGGGAPDNVEGEGLRTACLFDLRQLKGGCLVPKRVG